MLSDAQSPTKADNTDRKFFNNLRHSAIFNCRIFKLQAHFLYSWRQLKQGVEIRGNFDFDQVK